MEKIVAYLDFHGCLLGGARPDRILNRYDRKRERDRGQSAFCVPINHCFLLPSNEPIAELLEQAVSRFLDLPHHMGQRPEFLRQGMPGTSAPIAAAPGCSPATWRAPHHRSASGWTADLRGEARRRQGCAETGRSPVMGRTSQTDANRSFDGPSRVSDRSQETATDALGQPLNAAEYFIIIRTRLANRVPRSKIKNEGSKLWPISHRTGRSNALPSSRLPMDKVTRLDA